MNKGLRTFDTGANRNSSDGKYDYAGFNNPLVDLSYAKYMHQHRKLEDGTLRDSDNWQKGIPPPELLKSFLRHVEDVRLIMMGVEVIENGKKVTLEHALNGCKFNNNALILNEVKDLKVVSRNETK